MPDLHGCKTTLAANSSLSRNPEINLIWYPLKTFYSNSTVVLKPTLVLFNALNLKNKFVCCTGISSLAFFGSLTMMSFFFLFLLIYLVKNINSFHQILPNITHEIVHLLIFETTIT